MSNDKKSTHLTEESKNKKSNGEQSDLCDLDEKVTLKPQLQADQCLTTWLQIGYRKLLSVYSIRTGADLVNRSCFFGINPAELGK